MPSVNFVNSCSFGGPDKYLFFFYVEELLTVLWVAMDAALGLLQTVPLTVLDLILVILLGL